MSVDSRELTVLVHVDCIMNFLPSCCRRPKCRLKSFLTVCLALGVLGTCLILTVYHIDVNVVSSKRAQVGATFGETRSVGRQNLKPLQTAKRFVLSQDTSAKKRRLPFVFRPKNSLYMKDDMFYTLPKVSPFSGRSLGVCSLVGNGGILTGSKCGEQIDSSDFVIRFNMAPVCPPYLDDIGRRTDMVTTSRDRMRSKFDSLKSHTGREKFVNHLHHQYGQDTYIVSAPFTVKGNIGSLLGIPEVLTSHNSSAVPLFINPSHAGTMLQTWRKLGLKLSEGETNFSSGFYYASVALELCDQVNMYGFWPFPEDREGRPVRYHYYKSVDSGGLNNRWHDMDKEFEKLLEFHNHGVLQLISGNCR
ncbi:alpha-2,8-sialyltransferase 8F-like isoform X2 [Branchiostoma lanceolatum]|uniref:alpha-2,8-sialyltransferase 8F-like isoform X2 n=1 Tax=Branchiostoma lanceolatum TaxID=7740 RepID=UPI00345502E0